MLNVLPMLGMKGFSLMTRHVRIHESENRPAKLEENSGVVVEKRVWLGN